MVEIASAAYFNGSTDRVDVQKRTEGGKSADCFSRGCGEEPLHHRSNPFSILRKIEQIKSW
jgi:hypothetical protein